MITFKSPYSDKEVALYLSRKKYARDNNIRLELMDAVDHSPYAVCTVWIDGLAYDEVAIKNYSENEGILDLLVNEGIVEPPHRYETSGFVSIPVCKIK